MQKLKVCELFAGVGGFRLGLESTGHFDVVWSNQWEPSTKKQHASLVYAARFGEQNHSDRDIASVPTEDIPDHDVLVGGFPCQDYSVASTLKNAKGLIGKKGVLWWSIHRILSEKQKKPDYLILENVDRLLKSPSQQRGRDFAIMLKGLSDLGYVVEWRVINAADYGMPQRRRRIFILAYSKTSKISTICSKEAPLSWVTDTGVLASAFPTAKETKAQARFSLEDDIVSLSQNFNSERGLSPFQNAGMCIEGTITTVKTTPSYDGPVTVLADILQQDEISDAFFIPYEHLERWEYLKGAKSELRTTKEGYSYQYKEGSMVFPDALGQPSRTIITGEGGKSPSRFKHVVQTPRGLRRLTPVELERLNMFPDNHTRHKDVTDAKRAFFMGNALVVGIVEKIGLALVAKIQE